LLKLSLLLWWFLLEESRGDIASTLESQYILDELERDLHGLEYEQKYPVTQVVGPVQGSPPPISLVDAPTKGFGKLTFLPSTSLRRHLLNSQSQQT